MGKYLGWFAMELDVSTLINGFLRSFWTFKLDVAKTAAFSIWEHLEFARSDRSKLDESVEKFLLSHFKSDITDEHVSLWIHFTTLLNRGTDSDSVNCRVVNSFSAALCFSCIEELKESIAILTLGLLVNTNDSLEDVVALRFHMLV